MAVLLDDIHLFSHSVIPSHLHTNTLLHRQSVTSQLVVDWSLVIGHWSLVIGHWSLVIGHWSLVIGHWSLVIGHWSLVIGHWSLVTGSTVTVTAITTTGLTIRHRHQFNWPTQWTELVRR
ncbi:MAG: hypothetical protein JWQ21_2960 [Herminiimonas sp.]|nr:hypothetical protein [Herminiimonas sp.]